MAITIAITGVQNVTSAVASSSTSFSVAIWARRDNGGTNAEVGVGLTGFSGGVTTSSPITANFGWSLSTSGTFLHVFIGDGTSTLGEWTCAIIDDTAWHHYAFTRTGSATPVIYVDGVSQLVTTVTSAGVIIRSGGTTGTANENLYSSAGLAGNTWTADDYRTYSRVLSANEIATIARAGGGNDNIVSSLNRRLVFTEKAPGGTQGNASGCFKDLAGVANAGASTSSGSLTYAESPLAFGRRVA